MARPTFNPDPERGLINTLLVLIPGVKAQPWLANPQTVLLCSFIVLTWKYFGFYILLFMTGFRIFPRISKRPLSWMVQTRAR